MAHGGQGALAAPALAPCDPMSLCSHICCARPWECGACRLHMVFITGQIFWLQVKRVLFPVELSCGSMQHNVCGHTDLLCPPAALTWRKEGTCGVEDEQSGVLCLGAFVMCVHICNACCTCTAWTNPLQWKKQRQLPTVSCGSCLFSYCGISVHLGIFCILKARCRNGLLVVRGSE